MSTATVSSTSTSATSGALKVKVWYDRETCVVLRLPPRGTFNYEDLYRKIVERRRLEYGQNGHEQPDEDVELEIEYRDEKSGNYYRLDDEDTLEVAVARNDKLTLVVRAAGDR